MSTLTAEPVMIGVPRRELRYVPRLSQPERNGTVAYHQPREALWLAQLGVGRKSATSVTRPTPSTGFQHKRAA